MSFHEAIHESTGSGNGGLLSGIGAYTAAAGAESSLKPSPDAALYAYGYHQRPYPLEPGPHLFVDWRYLNPGHVTYRYRGERIQRDRPEEYGPEINSRSKSIPGTSPTGIRIEVQPAGKLGPVIRNDRPWEFFTPYVTLIHHEGKYLLFYNTTTYRSAGARKATWSATPSPRTD